MNVTISNNMARAPKILLPKTVVMVTTRVQEGLPFICTPYMDRIMWSALALAQLHHPIRIIGFVLMGNHIHLMILVENPDDVSGFMERFKTESAHAINCLLGRRQRSIWCDGYDSPTILTREDLLRKLKYIYTNPAEAALVHSITSYPGISSWEMLRTKTYKRKVLRIRRDMLEKLPSRTLNYKQQIAFTERIEAKGNETLTLTLEPDAWTECFKEGAPEDFEKKLLNEIAAHEAELRRVRGDRVIGEKALRLESFFKSYQPKKFAPRMMCICSDLSLRRSFIAYIRHLKERAREILARWKMADFSEPFPAGLFPPRLPRLVNALPPHIEL